MKKILLLLSLIMVFNTPQCISKEVLPNNDMQLPCIFIYSFPDDFIQTAKKDKTDTTIDEMNAPSEEYINSEDFDESEISLEDVSTPLKGYAEYVEGIEEIYMSDKTDRLFLKIKNPKKIGSKDFSLAKAPISKFQAYDELYKYSSEEYKISANSSKTMSKVGNFSMGTTYGSDIDTSQLEYSAGMFARYQKKHFALSSSYQKNLNTAYSGYIDKFYIVPEIKINNIFSIQEKFSADITRNRKTNELIFKVNPYGNRGDDRLNLQVGASQTFDAENTLYRTQLKFSTEFKL